VPKRLIIAPLLAVVLIGCGQGPAPTGQPASSAAAGEVAVKSQIPSVEPSVAPVAAPTPTPAASPTPIPTPTPTPTPEPWQSYTSKKLKYSMKYPPDWVVTPATPGYGDSFDDGRSTFVFVDRDVVDSGYVSAVDRTAKAEIAYYQSHYDAKVLSNKKAKVAGWNGRLIKMVGKEDGVDTYYQLLLLAKGRVGYWLDWRSDHGNRDTDKALFERIYKTFKPKS
jgi:hypothetical protein